MFVLVRRTQTHNPVMMNRAAVRCLGGRMSVSEYVNFGGSEGGGWRLRWMKTVKGHLRVGSTRRSRHSVHECGCRRQCLRKSNRLAGPGELFMGPVPPPAASFRCVVRGQHPSSDKCVELAGPAKLADTACPTTAHGGAHPNASCHRMAREQDIRSPPSLTFFVLSMWSDG